MNITVVGAGAFGTALAICLSKITAVTLWGRNGEHAAAMRQDRENRARLPNCAFPDALEISASLQEACAGDIVLLAVPMQQLKHFIDQNQAVLTQKTLVACCKGMDLESELGPLDVILRVLPDSQTALLTGPSFARDIASGLPTGLTLACADEAMGRILQHRLSTPTLRLYRTQDTVGASLGGALKNVIAIACGAAMGAGLGESARAAVMTRGFAEIQRLAVEKGAQPGTLAGLSGFGDLVLTCTSTQSRNYRLGVSIGEGVDFDPTTTVEGAATAKAAHKMAQKEGLDMPITAAVAGLVENRLDVQEAMQRLLSRSLKEE
ncbi:Glycerol-3-phosphate dehydrogenase [NAD(P)+] [Roseobacter fucihabitans]|uniref:Glycerol-3-phosphate dehydrogenase [NAD(P)+] n=1 Tax=Roseobacter fucihabitans TaxID=1537242 RepID=A0ABZ2BYY9_9RHOB|nr:NAD(P)H-dependent glycerol-3-phosphate dehydrogenase [Roseobacter litoralis]MBC6963902.1 Glycerol-3-phosphate dehydrogenase (NAD(P)+) [Roseobacter litoralis]MBC6964013.1 Glycerol-3-phosphate dehydrogenase (NAD(P)+) [Roseobacter litoralis]